MTSVPIVPEARACPSLLIQPDWTGWSCQLGAGELNSTGVWNAISGLVPQVSHEAAFGHLSPWQGKYTQSHTQEVLVRDFLGFLCPRDLYCGHDSAHRSYGEAYAIRTRVCDSFLQLQDLHSDYYLSFRWPVVSEEYFEYAAVLSSVVEYLDAFEEEKLRGSTPRPFAFVELGAGYGHWSFAAHLALRRVAAHRQLLDLPRHRYLLVDAVDASMAAHELARLNEVETNGPEGFLNFHQGFVTSSGHFDLSASRAYAAWIVRSFSAAWGGSSASAAVEAVSLQAVLVMYDMPCVIDMLDVDIQGGEYHLFSTNETMSLLKQRVRRIHIGLHSQSAHRNLVLKARFRRWGWGVKWLWHSNLQDRMLRETPWGPVVFADGVLTVVNSRQLDGSQCP
ncbi:unnamed protein product [Polarella glacialis]|uniref:Methyltransferase FkbM domain-containing protein n=1 Tax=Polarella glacialis TaxID=89957 RepID=A0A813KTA8_POLGL|nr:unnamed protein product [Polarella glacialis]CAE8708926.1 unnamed protein product [Polarella glacialis]